jgi:molybdopterin-guanine dinucleotide biosynthesis protein A
MYKRVRNETSKRNPMKGLILSGGFSKRMGKDKGAICYHGKTQVSHTLDLLSKYCSDVYVSVRSDQTDQSHLRDLPLLIDSVEGDGPIVGILSAFEKDQNSPWLVLACDMPLIDEANLKKLIDNRDESKTATCFENTERNWPEPLFTIWEPSSTLKINEFVSIGKPCPRKILMNSEIKMILPTDQSVLKNFNTPQDLKSL